MVAIRSFCDRDALGSLSVGLPTLACQVVLGRSSILDLGGGTCFPFSYHTRTPSTKSIAFPTSERFTALVFALRCLVPLSWAHVAFLCFSSWICVTVGLVDRWWLGVLQPLHRLSSPGVCVCTLLSIPVDATLRKIVCAATSSNENTPSVPEIV